MKAKNPRLRNAFITWNNYPANYMETLEALPTHNYICVGKEIGKKRGTPHLHIHVEFEKQQQWNAVAGAFPSGTDVQARKGTGEQATIYCKKEGDYHEVGTMNRPGKRTDLDVVREQLEDGDAIREIVKTATSMQSIRFAEVYLNYHERQRDWKPEVIWYFGKAGTSKTRLAREHAIQLGFKHDIHTQIKSAKWWQGYDQHKVVLLDDIRKEFCTFVEILGILDRYPFRVECKGGSRQLLAERIYITAPVHPEYLWPTTEEKHQLLRRIDTIIEVLSYTNVRYHKLDGILEEDFTEASTQELQEEANSDEGSETICEESDASGRAQTELVS